MNNNIFFIFQTKPLKISLKQANILKLGLRHFVAFDELGGLWCYGEIGEFQPPKSIHQQKMYILSAFTHTVFQSLYLYFTVEIL